MTKTQKILEHLNNGNSITPHEALRKFSCFRLASIIHNLKNKGHDIHNITRNGEYATYQLNKE